MENDPPSHHPSPGNETSFLHLPTLLRPPSQTLTQPVQMFFYVFHWISLDHSFKSIIQIDTDRCWRMIYHRLVVVDDFAVSKVGVSGEEVWFFYDGGGERRCYGCKWIEGRG